MPEGDTTPWEAGLGWAVDLDKTVEYTGKAAILMSKGQERVKQGGIVCQSATAVEAGAKIINSKIRGPVIIGKKCLIQDSYIGPFTSIGDRTEIKDSEMEYSIVLRDCKVINVGIRIEGSILGNDVEVVEAVGKPRVHRFMIGDQSRIEVA